MPKCAHCPVDDAPCPSEYLAPAAYCPLVDPTHPRFNRDYREVVRRRAARDAADPGAPLYTPPAATAVVVAAPPPTPGPAPDDPPPAEVTPTSSPARTWGEHVEILRAAESCPHRDCTGCGCKGCRCTPGGVHAGELVGILVCLKCRFDALIAHD